MNISKAGLLVAAILLFSNLSSAEFNYQTYRDATLKEIISEHSATFFGDTTPVDFGISGALFKYRVRSEYTGNLRTLRPGTRRFIEYWAKALGQDRSVVELFKRELLVREGGLECWMPVQEQLVPYLEDELKPGDAIDLYIMLLGTSKEEWVFSVNEFQKVGVEGEAL